MTKFYGVQVTRFWVMNSYLIEEEDGLTLVDTGMSGSEKTILAAAQSLGQPIRRILITHAHVDHVGSLDGLAAQIQDVEVICSPQTARFLASDLTLETDQPQVKLKGSFTPCQAQITRTVEEGDRIGSLQVTAAPGHSPDQLTFLDIRDGSLYAGDAFQTQGGLAVSGDVRWKFPLPALATWHKPSALESAKKLLALRPNRLAVGHGPMLDSPQQAMQDAIQRAERKFND